MKRLYIYKVVLLFTAISIAAVSCHPVHPESPEVGGESDLTSYYVNIFSYNMMSTYYLWEKEIATKLKNWQHTAEPIAQVYDARYKNAQGNEIDKWTQLTDDFESFNSSMGGVSTTYGCSLKLYYMDPARERVCAVVRYTSAGSPARKEGLKRGDAIVAINGTDITSDNYLTLLNEQFLQAPSATVTLMDGSTKNMTAVNMYEDPVLLYKIFEFNGKKVGYLVYNSFTADSWERLIEACRVFRAESVSELILDLRYNGGGYVVTENTLASMLAPIANVENEDIFETSVYNEAYTAAITKHYGWDALNTRFQQNFQFNYNGREYSYSTSDANIGIHKLYVIMTGSSASASEALVTGLIPYMDVGIIGEQSYGKYCTGMVYSATDWYSDVKDQIPGKEYQEGIANVNNWGIYVMIGRFADANGNTPCYPFGFTPDVEVQDNPTEPYQLGDEREAMLRAALECAGYIFPDALSAKPSPASVTEATRAAALSPLIPAEDLVQPRSISPEPVGLIMDNPPAPVLPVLR